MAIQVGDLVFDNLNPNGIPFALWANDLGVGFPGMALEIVDIYAGACKSVQFD